MLFCAKTVFESSPAFTDATFQEVAFNGSFEQLLGDRNKQAVCVLPVCTIDEADVTHAAMSSSGKKFFDSFLAGQSFFLRKSIRRVCIHFSCL